MSAAIVPNPHPKIFVPGKVIQVRSRNKPLVLSKLVFISVEEHSRHVAEMMEWIYPNATTHQKAGAKLHDVCKKTGALVRVNRRRPSPEILAADFYGYNADGLGLAPSEAASWFCEDFLQIKDGKLNPESRRIRLWPTYDRSDIRVDLDPPFGNHAADATERDLEPYVDDTLDLARDSESCDYVLNLVRLHHSFQPDRIIPACARHGEGIVKDLYRLIVADHLGSRWSEYIVQQLEEGLEKLEGKDFFGDVEVTVAEDAELDREQDGLCVGRVVLRRGSLTNNRQELIEKEMVVRYFSKEVNWDLKQLLESQAAGRVTKRARGPRRRGRR